MQALEESQEGEDGAQRVSWAFFWQTPGVMGPYAVALLMYVLTDDPSLRSLPWHMVQVMHGSYTYDSGDVRDAGDKQMQVMRHLQYM